MPLVNAAKLIRKGTALAAISANEIEILKLNSDEDSVSLIDWESTLAANGRSGATFAQTPPIVALSDAGSMLFTGATLLAAESCGRALLSAPTAST